MNKNEDFEFEENIITVSSKELKNILISKIAHNEIVEIADIAEDGISHMRFEGEFGWKGDFFLCICKA